ncbi:PAS domain-containing protein [Actinomyces respiraculi]|uniref:PAS domain-containing protein n=1 Tax=Actinomyces respiraculi TaxID=2744574 RepID=UPI0018E0934A|nr:PAS domain-containing protein [Actinomyces respiraculi]
MADAAAGRTPETLAPVGERTYLADEIFFSTTDARGRIRRANSTFMRLSGYPRGALVGRPHNVVRHEDMPAGVFRAIWDGLEQGMAVSAYITNKAADGATYRVFGTIVPSGDGYLSVRTLPMLTELRDRVEEVYVRVRAVEAASAEAGSTAREVAAAGYAALLTELRAMGYRDTVDFTRQTLAAEVSALVAAGVDIPERPEAEGPVAEILAGMNSIEVSTGGLVALLDECARLVDLLGRRVADIGALGARLGGLREALRAAADDDVLRARYEEVDGLLLEAAEELHPLAGQVEELRADTDSVRFTIALLRLHNLAAGFFANQVLGGDDVLEDNDAVGSLRELVTALSDGSVSLSQRLALFRARAALVAGDLELVAQTLTDTEAPLSELVAGLGPDEGHAALPVLTGNDAPQHKGSAQDPRLAAAAGAVGFAGGPAAPAAALQAVAGMTPSARARALGAGGFPEARALAEAAVAVRDLEVPDESEAIAKALVGVRGVLASLRR